MNYLNVVLLILLIKFHYNKKRSINLKEENITLDNTLHKSL